MSVPTPSGPLVGVRVVEWGSGILVPFASRLLADLGAEVMKVSSGHTAEADAATLFAALNAGKQQCLLDPVEASNRVAFLDLLAQADVFLTDKDADDVSRYVVDPEPLTHRFPGLVVARGSTFGASTPELVRNDTTALHVSAATGFSSLIGHPDRTPLPLPLDLPDYIAGANLAAAALAAHLGSLRRGPGQVVEVAASEVMFYISVVCATLASLGAPRVYRAGRSMPGSGGMYPFRFFATADGAVAVACRSQRDWLALLEMAGSPEWAQGPGWNDPTVVARQMSDVADAHLEPWFREQESEDLFARARAAGLPLAPVRTIATLLAEPQSLHRRSWSADVRVGGGQQIRFLRAPARFSRTPVAQDVDEFRCDALPSFSGPRRDRQDPSKWAGSGGASLLDGIRVLDLSWVWSGPMAAATLADLGAEVLKVEHPGRLDNARLRGRPVRDGVPMEGPPEELSVYFHQNNRGKKSVELDLKDPAGAARLRQLAATADVVIDNLSPGVFDKLGLGYDVLSAQNPRLIWLGMSAAGKDGPLAGMRAYAPIMSAMAGLEALVGYPDDPMVGMILAGIGDPNASSHALLALLAALVEREHSGLGQFIDFSQVEAMVADMCEPIADYLTTGREPKAFGAGHPRHSPHGNYPCAGEDSWVAIAVVDDDGWRRLATAMGAAPLADAERFSTAASRCMHREAIDDLVSAWTRRRAIDDVVSVLAEVGITAVPVVEVVDAPRMFGSLLTECAHPLTGRESLAAVPWRFSRTPARVTASAPLVGQHTAEILGPIAERSTTPALTTRT